MAGMMGIEIRTAEYRPCYVDGKKALFHRWENRVEVVEPSIMVGGHPGGQIKRTCAIVEYEDGRIESVYPTKVRFVPGKMNDYSFGEESKE